MNTDPKHPPLNTPLSAFTPEMLDRLPGGSAFGPGQEVSGVVVKDDRGWRFKHGDRYAPDFGTEGWDQTRPLIRVGPEQAGEPAPLPDPWPGMIVDVDADDGNRYRAAIAFVRTVVDRTWIGFAAMGAKDARWNEGHVHEVRTPDGVTVWKRAKVTT